MNTIESLNVTYSWNNNKHYDHLYRLQLWDKYKDNNDLIMILKNIQRFVIANNDSVNMYIGYTLNPSEKFYHHIYNNAEKWDTMYIISSYRGKDEKYMDNIVHNIEDHIKKYVSNNELDIAFIEKDNSKIKETVINNDVKYYLYLLIGNYDMRVYNIIKSISRL